MFRFHTLDDSTFESAIGAGGGLVAVDFTAAWCPPCRVLAPTLERLAEAYASRHRVFALDVDLSPSMAARFGVRSLPTVVFFHDGVEVDRTIGAVPEIELRERIEANLTAANAP